MRVANDLPVLFPILPKPPGGLAGLAAWAAHISHGHQVEFRALEVRSILNRTASRRGLSFAYAINPYRGCEFGCRYCYARYTHEFPAAGDPGQGSPEFRDPQTFERLIFLKENAAWLLEQELRGIDPAMEIALGTATDPYQPVERTSRITRSLLEVFARRSGYKLGIVTKSRMILRDMDLLTRIAEKNRLVVHLTITTPDARLARLLEPRAPRPDLRLEAVRRLRAVGITAGVVCSPLLPGITDSEEAIARMAGLAAKAGASFFAAQPLFLKSCSRPTYLSFVREHFPHLLADHQARFATRDFAAEGYRRRLADDVRRACERHGLPQRTSEAPLTSDAGGRRQPPGAWQAPAQARLFA